MQYSSELLTMAMQLSSNLTSSCSPSPSPSPCAESSCRSLLHSILSCAKQKDLPHARWLHAQVLLHSPSSSPTLFPLALLHMYLACGAPAEEDARSLLHRLLPPSHPAAWSSLIRLLARHGHARTALLCFRKMRSLGLWPDEATLASALRACTAARSIHLGRQIHAEARRRGLLDKNAVLGTVLMDMYARFGMLGRARQVFEELPVRDVVSWSVLIRGFARHGHGIEAVECFHRMRDEGVSPDAVTFVCILKACSSSSDFFDMGEEIHGEIRKLGLLKKKDDNGILATALVDMYAKSGSPRKARQVFDDELPVRDVVAWSVMMAGYVEHGCAHDAMQCFRCMQEEGILPDAFSFACILQACSKTGCIAMGTWIHAAVRSIGLVKKNTVLATTLVDMYAKCGHLGSAKEVFDELPERDVVNWSALMNAYLRHGFTDEALHCFHEMRSEGIFPNVVTFACALRACAGRGSLGAGEEIHGEVSCRGLLDSEAMLGIALVDMYGKCARIMEARQVFEKLPTCDVAAWNVLLAGHTQLGRGTDAMMLFDRMLSEDILPDAITFVTLLAALSHAGLLEEGREVFSGMASIYDIVPSLEHHACMVDLFSRAGQLHASAMLIECMRSSNDRLSLLLALLSACQRWRHTDELAKWAFEQCLQLDGTCASAYVFMGNICTGSGVHGGNVR